MRQLKQKHFINLFYCLWHQKHYSSERYLLIDNNCDSILVSLPMLEEWHKLYPFKCSFFCCLPPPPFVPEAWNFLSNLDAQFQQGRYASTFLILSSIFYGSHEKIPKWTHKSDISECILLLFANCIPIRGTTAVELLFLVSFAGPMENSWDLTESLEQAWSHPSLISGTD